MTKITWLLLLTLWLAGCVSTPRRPFVSPIIPNKVPVMLDNQWRLTEAIHNGEQGEFDSIQPVLMTFQLGIVSFQACNAKSFFIDTTKVDNANEYGLIQADGTNRQCENGGTEQEGVFLEALMATNHYEIIDDTLILSGDYAQLTFVLDNEAEKPPDW